MITVYGMTNSGNCYKPRLLLGKLGKPFRHIEANFQNGMTQSPEFLAKNPNGMVPLLELEDGRLLAESNAILLYLAEGTQFLPGDAYERGLAYQWMFFEQYSHEPYIAVRRALLTIPEKMKNATPERLAVTLERGNKALRVMDVHLASHDFFAGKTLSVADLALYAYTHDAGAGGFVLADYPNILAWLERVTADPGHVPMQWIG
ncbi:glutathione S-transferase family protein [Mesorhizobium sp. SB112]|uniref:glutathione S-transferase family protein n=1 Tax=Mesorhizobium sp. SB112 TaxID=3151853 RepID=UPI00326349D5